MSTAGTERLHPLAEDLDEQSSITIVQRMHQEDLLSVQAVGHVLPAIARAADLIAEALRAGGRLFYVGAGTSGRLGFLDAVECPPTFGVAPSRVVPVLAGGTRALSRAVEGAEDDAVAGAKAIARWKVGPKDCVTGITASGTTPFVLGALQAATKRKARTVLVCCNQVRLTPPVAQVVIAPLTGAEIVAGSTRLKAGTATKLVLNALSTTAMVRLGKVYRGRMVDLKTTNAKLRQRALDMLMALGDLDEATARQRLRESHGSVREALVRTWTGASVTQARRLARTAPLRTLEKRRPPRK